MTVKVSVPTFIEVQDYHEFDSVQTYLKKLNPSLKVKEIGFNGNYVGLIYSGRFPAKDKVQALAKKQKIQLTLDADEFRFMANI